MCLKKYPSLPLEQADGFDALLPSGVSLPLDRVCLTRHSGQPGMCLNKLPYHMCFA